jgi:hypothetical protein
LCDRTIQSNPKIAIATKALAVFSGCETAISRDWIIIFYDAIPKRKSMAELSYLQHIMIAE